MVEEDDVGGGLLAELSLLVDAHGLVNGGWDHADRSDVLRLLGTVRAVVREEQAIELRQARVLAWLKTKDLAAIDFPSWTAFLAEHGGWSPSWTRDLIRLVESPLDAVKRAASEDLIPLTVAVLAPKEVGPNESEESWLKRAVMGAARAPVRPKVARAELDVVSGREAAVIGRARALARLLLGWDAPRTVIDDFVIACWREQACGADLLEAARTPPPVPERLGRTVPDWKDDPAQGLLGPWVEPKDPADALARFLELQALGTARTHLLGMAYTLIKTHHLWRESSADSLEEFSSWYLGRSMRTFQRYAALGWELLVQPELRRAVEGGLACDRAELLVRLAGDHAMGTWLDLARRLGTIELKRAVRFPDAKARYAAVAAEAQRIEATETGGPALPVALRAPHVALREEPPEPPAPAWMLVRPELVPAATWFVANVVPDPAYGVRRVAASDAHTCQNPLCRRHCIRVHVHHIVERHLGGTDDPSNLITLCPACHLRLVHGARPLQVRRQGDFILWTSSLRAPVLMYSPVGRGRRDHETAR